MSQLALEKFVRPAQARRDSPRGTSQDRANLFVGKALGVAQNHGDSLIRRELVDHALDVPGHFGLEEIVERALGCGTAGAGHAILEKIPRQRKVAASPAVVIEA